MQSIREKPGLILIPEDTDSKFYIQHLYPYHLAYGNAKDKIILEVGFGDGYGSFYLAEVARMVIGIDCEEENVKNAQNKYKRNNLDFEMMQAINLGFKDETFDIVFSSQVIEHIKEDKLMNYLLEIYRVLKTSGILYLVTLNKEVAMKPGQFYKKNPYHEKEFNEVELRELLLKVFPKVDMYGLHPAAKHIFFKRLKKIGIFKNLPEAINPVERFYKNIKLSDFVASKQNLKKALDFIAICSKGF